MKLSEIKGEAALDAVADIIEPLSIIVADKQFMQDYKTKPKLLVIKSVLKGHKQEVLQILAVLDQKSIEEYMETVNLLTLPMQILDVVDDPEFEMLFRSQGQITEKTSSGSAMVNTEASEN